MKIGKLKEVNIRELWKHEQLDFSKWLAEPENLTEIGDALGLDLVDVKLESYVGAYRCDIFAQDASTGSKIIVENQLETSDHDHLGKIITYASGLDAEVIVWIVRRAREEHRSAIEWLNNNTNNRVNFFLIELHAYTIGDSLPAPKFEIIEKPNDFIKARSVNSDQALNKSQSERLEFWSRFNEILAERGEPFNIRKATTDHWYDVALGTSSAHISINLVNKESAIVVDFYIKNNKELFDKLFEKKDEIEGAVEHKLIWDKIENGKASRIKYIIRGLNFDDHSNYDKLMNTAIDVAIKMRKVFKKYL